MIDVTSNVLDKAKPNPARAVVETAHALGLVRISKVEDPHWRFEDLCGDMFNPQVNPEIPAEQLKREKARYKAKVYRVGVWGAVLEVRTSPLEDWFVIDSIWGFVGNDFIGSGYDNDYIAGAADWLNGDIYLPGSIALKLSRFNDAIQAYQKEQAEVVLVVDTDHDEVTEADEVAQAIHNEWYTFWPLTPAAAVKLAGSQMPGESRTAIDNVAAALLKINERV